MNYSDMLNTTKVITADCWNWCSEQNFIFESNLTLKGMAIPALALISLFIGSFIYTFSDKIIEKTDLSEENISKIYHLCNIFSKYLLLGFFIWWVWFK